MGPGDRRFSNGIYAAGTTYAGLAAETGTSADMSTVANFNVASDVLDFAGLGGWGNGGTNAMGGIGTLANKDSAHVLVAYQDLGGNTRIADVALDNVSGTATASSTALIEHASDIVQLTGVSLTSLTAADIHFIHN